MDNKFKNFYCLALQETTKYVEDNIEKWNTMIKNIEQEINKLSTINLHKSISYENLILCWNSFYNIIIKQNIYWNIGRKKLRKMAEVSPFDEENVKNIVVKFFPQESLDEFKEHIESNRKTYNTMEKHR